MKHLLLTTMKGSVLVIDKWRLAKPLGQQSRPIADQPNPPPAKAERKLF
jgi:hypothetical protein